MNRIPIEVVCGDVKQQILFALTVTPGTCVADAINQSGILTQFPTLNLTTTKVGIFSRPVTLTTPLRANDRIEIYAPIQCDPKTVRREKAKK